MDKLKIIHELWHCANNDCEKCQYYDKHGDCMAQLEKDVKELIGILEKEQEHTCPS